VVELGDDGQVLAQLDDRHPGSPVIVQADQLRVQVQRSGRCRAKNSYPSAVQAFSEWISKARAQSYRALALGKVRTTAMA
jgi:hypothetical protein